ncbi:two-component system activity regulator YycH [Neobacillus sp. FSL H8-0543]|uniref:YycH family regulatory protein n=1 Tax=Neobacillus sp. FSL H8-0543 TaxID=2954672 RepID=UPI00315941F8
MKYETSKSLILIVLVLFSLVLTWNLWTYQPNYNTLDSRNYVAEVTLSEKQELDEIIRPDLALFHLENKHYGTTNATDLDLLIKEISRWSFYDVKNYSNDFQDLKSLMHGNGNVEIVFPGEVPIDLYRNILKFEDKNIPSFNFDRIIIKVEGLKEDSGTVYFVSADKKQVYMSHVTPSIIIEFNKNFFMNAEKYPAYFAVEATEKRTVFIPEGEMEMMEYKYLPFVLNSEAFKDALFSNPSFVQKSPIPHGEEFTDVSSKMTVNDDSNMLVYVNPTAEEKYTVNSNDLLKRSIDYINEHGGWTDPYRYVSNDEINHSVTFQLYSSDGFPVFNDKGLTEIKEVWGQDEIIKYIRPNISLELPLTTETKKVTVPSGREVFNYLESKKSFRKDLLRQVVLGYRMERGTDENKLILLEPAWFYLYDQRWGQISMDDLGGLMHGLE